MLFRSGTESEDDLKGLFDDLDVNSNKLGGTVEKRNQQLVKLLKSIEGLSLGEYTDHTIDAFGDAGAVQCGFCTPGMMMATEALLTINKKPGEPEIREALSGNLCRCTGYDLIVKGVQIASERGKDLW